VLERGLRFTTSLLLGFWVARHLGLTDFGRLSYVLVSLSMLSTLSELGLEQVLRRCFLQDPARRADYLGAAFFLRLAAGLLCAVLLGSGLLLGAFPRGEALLLVVAMPLLLQPALFAPDAWLQAQLQARVSVGIQAVSLLVGAALRVVLILLGAQVVWFVGIAGVEMLVAGAGFYLQMRGWGGRLRFPTVALARDLLVQALPLLLASVATILYMRIDVMMLRAMRGVEAVGLYSAGIRFSEVWFFLPGILASSLLPGLLTARAKDPGSYAGALQRFFDLNVLCGVGIAVPTSLVAPWLVGFAYGAAFAAASSVTIVHVWTLVFIFLGVARGQFLVNEGLGWFYVFSNAGGALVNVVLNLLLIPRLGAAGAAFGTLSACAFSGWLSGWLHPRTRDAAWMQARALLLPWRIPGLWRSFASRRLS
jgi:O-antigen/teichoic acid export membrane protein